MTDQRDHPREYALADRLHSSAIHLLRLLRLQDAKTGIGPARLSALSVLVFGSPKSLKELAEIEQVQPPTMSRIVEALERQGLIRRAIVARDRRQIRLEPTDKGERILLEARQQRVMTLAKRLQGLPEADLEVLENALGVLREVIEKR